MALIRQCELAGVPRSTVYLPHQAVELDEQELTLLTQIDAEYTRHPFYGSRKMTVYLRGLGYRINRKRVRRLMGKLGLAGMAPGPDTQPAPPAAQDLSVPAAWGGGDTAQPGMEHRYQCAAASGVRDEGMTPRNRLAGAGCKPP